MSNPEVFLDHTDKSLVVSWGDRVHRMTDDGKVSHRWSPLELSERTETHHDVTYLTREQLMGKDDAITWVLRQLLDVPMTRKVRDAISDALDVDWPKPEEKSA